MPTLIDQIKEIAEDVYTALGYGHLEAPYQEAMEVGLRLRGIKFEAQKPMPIIYLNHVVGLCRPDLLVADTIAVELKAGGQPEAMPQDHQQLRKYLRLSGVSAGMLINFASVGRGKKAKPIPSKPDISVVTNDA